MLVLTAGFGAGQGCDAVFLLYGGNLHRGDLCRALVAVLGLAGTVRQVEAVKVPAHVELFVLGIHQLAAVAQVGSIGLLVAEEKRRAERRLKDAEEAVTRNDNIKAGLKLKLESRRRQQAEAADALQKADKERSNTSQRIHILEDLERNMDGYQQSVKAVMRAAAGRRLRGIIGPVAGILTVEKGYETAIETALGFALQNIVVEDQGCARAAIGFLKDERAGRATFLPLDTVQPGVFRGRLSGTARLASSLVQADARYDNIVSNLLGRIIVVDDINEASRVARDNGYHNKVVTMDGQVINAGGSFTGGSVQRSAGLFTRKQEMEELRLKAAKLQKDCLAAQEKTDQCKEQADALQAELTATASEQITAANDRVRAEAEQKRLEAAAAQLETAVQNAQQQMDALQAALNDSRAKADAAAFSFSLSGWIHPIKTVKQP